LDFATCLNQARCVEEQILSKCRAAGFGEHDLFAIKLAVEEALVNACKHGNKLNADKQVKVRFRVTPQRAEIVIEDQGAGFKPSDVPDPTACENLTVPHGRGILLMRAYMSNVVFSPSGNKVTLIKYNEGRPGAAALG